MTGKTDLLKKACQFFQLFRLVVDASEQHGFADQLSGKCSGENSNALKDRRQLEICMGLIDLPPGQFINL